MGCSRKTLFVATPCAPSVHMCKPCRVPDCTDCTDFQTGSNFCTDFWKLYRFFYFCTEKIRQHSKTRKIFQRSVEICFFGTHLIEDCIANKYWLEVLGCPVIFINMLGPLHHDLQNDQTRRGAHRGERSGRSRQRVYEGKGWVGWASVTHIINHKSILSIMKDTESNNI